MPVPSARSAGGRCAERWLHRYQCGAFCYHIRMAMTLRLPAQLEDELRLAAEEDHRSLHQTVIHAVEAYLAARETAEVKADPEALRALAEAHEGDVVYGTEAVWSLMGRRRAS